MMDSSLLHVGILLGLIAVFAVVYILASIYLHIRYIRRRFATHVKAIYASLHLSDSLFFLFLIGQAALDLACASGLGPSQFIDDTYLSLSWSLWYFCVFSAVFVRAVEIVSAILELHQTNKVSDAKLGHRLLLFLSPWVLSILISVGSFIFLFLYKPAKMDLNSNAKGMDLLSIFSPEFLWVKYFVLCGCSLFYLSATIIIIIYTCCGSATKELYVTLGLNVLSLTGVITLTNTDKISCLVTKLVVYLLGVFLWTVWPIIRIIWYTVTVEERTSRTGNELNKKSFGKEKRINDLNGTDAEDIADRKEVFSIVLSKVLSDKQLHEMVMLQLKNPQKAMPTGAQLKNIVIG